MDKLDIDKLKNVKIIDLKKEKNLDINSVITNINSVKGHKLVKLPHKFHQQFEFNDLIKNIRFQELDIYHINDSEEDTTKNYYLMIQ